MPPVKDTEATAFVVKTSETEINDTPYEPHVDYDDQDDSAIRRSRILTENTIIDETNDGFAVIRVGSVRSGAINLAQSALGAGTLAMPLALRSAGAGLGIIFLLGIGAITVFTVRLLIQLAHKFHVHTYEDVAMMATGNRFFKWAVTAFTCGFCLGITIAYVITVGDILQPLLAAVTSYYDANEVGHRRVVVLGFWACFMLPLSLLRDITALRYPSLFAVAALVFLVVAMTTYTTTENVDWSKNLQFARFNISLVKALPTMFFSFCCQCNAFEIYHEMRPGTPNRVTKATGMAISLASVVYAIAGFMGVAAFGAATDGDILNNYKPADHVYMTIAFIGFAFTITFSFPVCLFPMRDTLLQAFNFGNAYTAPTIKRWAVAGCLAVVSLIVGLFVDSIVTVFSIVGSICCSSLAFTLPAYFAIKAEVVTRDTDDWKERARYYFTCFVMGFGIIAGVVGLGVSIYSDAS